MGPTDSKRPGSNSFPTPCPARLHPGNSLPVASPGEFESNNYIPAPLTENGPMNWETHWIDFGGEG